uniref:Glycoside hydrolase, family 79 n=1 Tax=Solibacter usitatus (strain Ellin6076) TaxID=234267 RepID=Q01WI4_SOLUE
MTKQQVEQVAGIILGGLAAVVGAALLGGAVPAPIAPGSLPRIGTVDERFQSFNIEMVEVTGGRFWKPYGKQVDAILQAQEKARKRGDKAPAGMDPELYQYRAPIDLANPRLRKLAAALGPAYLRVSGTWANSTYFHDSESQPPATPPEGFGSVLTRAQWKGVVDFARAVNAKLITSFATSTGTRDETGVWTPRQARQFLDYTKSVKGSIAAAEFMNEPNFAVLAGVPKGYDAKAYARDLAVFLPFAKKEAPDMVILGPGSVGEGGSLVKEGASLPFPMLKSEDLLAATGPVFDAFSYHFYGAVSQRCASMGPGGTTPVDALSDEWLARTNSAEAYYRGMRDRFNFGKPMWLTETADAACGGNPWGATFLDSFRYVNQLGSLAKRIVQVVAQNTLSASDYGLVDERTLTPRPNYWSAVLWRRFMGATVLEAGPVSEPAIHVYAHCLAGVPGGVALLAINADRGVYKPIEVAVAAERYTLTATDLLGSAVRLNGSELRLGYDGELPRFVPVPSPAGQVMLAPASITFLAIPAANNQSCR